MKQLHRTTLIPNIVIDKLLPILSGSEYKVITVIIRQTLGWKDQRTGKRKYRDWITNTQFTTKTGLSSKAISLAIKSLSDKDLISITDYRGNNLYDPNRRKHTRLYFSLNIQNVQILEGFDSKKFRYQRKKVPITKETVTKENILNSRFHSHSNELVHIDTFLANRMK